MDLHSWHNPAAEKIWHNCRNVTKEARGCLLQTWLTLVLQRGSGIISIPDSRKSRHVYPNVCEKWYVRVPIVIHSLGNSCPQSMLRCFSVMGELSTACVAFAPLCIPYIARNICMPCFEYAGDVPCARWAPSILQSQSLLTAQNSRWRSSCIRVSQEELYLAVPSDGLYPGTRDLTDSQPNLYLNENSKFPCNTFHGCIPWKVVEEHSTCLSFTDGAIEASVQAIEFSTWQI